MTPFQFVSNSESIEPIESLKTKSSDELIKIIQNLQTIISNKQNAQNIQNDINNTNLKNESNNSNIKNELNNSNINNEPNNSTCISISSSENKLNKSLNSNNSSNTKKIKKSKEMDWNKVEQRKIALQYSYLGQNYCGNAKQLDNSNTVEQKIIDALLKVKLLNPENENDFSRSGRTDKGVSGMRNIIVFSLRYSSSIDYIRILNRCLPDDIRITAWKLVDQSFDARFSCHGRIYKYFFIKNNKNIEKMREAASFLEGTHDFRNFCKLNVDETTKYERTIVYCRIQQADCGFKVSVPPQLQSNELKDYSQSFSQDAELWEIEICGRSFLWHMVRSIAAILFLVGEGNEQPSIVRDLLNIELYPARPQYKIASELPLLFYDSIYDQLDWNKEINDSNKDKSYSTFHELEQHFINIFEEHLIKCGMISTMLQLGIRNMKLPFTNENNIEYNNHENKNEWVTWNTLKRKLDTKSVGSKYKPIKDIPTVNSVDRELERSKQRKKRKLERNDE